MMLPEYQDYKLFARRAPTLRVPEDQSLRHRIVQSLAHQARLIQALEPGVREGRDPEFLHQFRVSLRRSRAIGEALQQVLGHQSLRKGIKGLKRTARQTSQLRDLDVFLETLSEWRSDSQLCDAIDASGAVPLAQDWQSEAQCRIRQMLVGAQYHEDIERWVALIQDGTVDDVAGRIRRKRIRKVLKGQINHHDRCLRSLSLTSPDADFHRVRKSLKRVRYLIELDPAHLGSGLRKLKWRQTWLGHFQDRHVQIALLEAMADPTQDRRCQEALAALIAHAGVEKQQARERILELKPLRN